MRFTLFHPATEVISLILFMIFVALGLYMYPPTPLPISSETVKLWSEMYPHPPIILRFFALNRQTVD